MTESWRPVDVTGYEAAYSVSDRGRFRREPGGRVLRHNVTKSSGLHPTVQLSVGGRKKLIIVAPMVARIFLGPPPFAGAVVGHKNGVKTDCRARNLHWTTRSDLSAHAGPVGKLGPARMAELMAMKGKITGREAADKFGISWGRVYEIWRDAKD
jgi:hypothetical protein